MCANTTFIEELDKYSAAIQAFMAIAIVFITIYTAIISRKMAIIMSRDLSFRSIPYLSLAPGLNRNFSIDNVTKTENHKKLRFVFQLSNVSSVPLIFMCKYVKLKEYDLTPDDRTYVLFPSQSITFMSKFQEMNDVQDDALGEYIKVRFQFWKDSMKKNVYFIERTYHIDHQNTYIHDDNYGLVSN